MSDQELSELLAHPRVRAFVERVAKEAALEAVSKVKVIVQSQAGQPKPAAEGDVNYTMAAAIIGCPVLSIRHYVIHSKLAKGKLPFTVTLESCIAFKARYKPRRNTRTSNT